MNSVVTKRLRLGRPSLGGVREAPEGGCRACVRGGTDAPWPSATEKEEMLAFARRPAETQDSWRPTLEAPGGSAAWSGRSYGTCRHTDQPRLLSRAPLALGAYWPLVLMASPLTANRIKVWTTSILWCRSASASAMTVLERGTPSASSSRTAGAGRGTMASTAAGPARVEVVGGGFAVMQHMLARWSAEAQEPLAEAGRRAVPRDRPLRVRARAGGQNGRASAASRARSLRACSSATRRYTT